MDPDYVAAYVPLGSCYSDAHFRVRGRRSTPNTTSGDARTVRLIDRDRLGRVLDCDDDCVTLLVVRVDWTCGLDRQREAPRVTGNLVGPLEDVLLDRAALLDSSWQLPVFEGLLLLARSSFSLAPIGSFSAAATNSASIALFADARPSRSSTSG